MKINKNIQPEKTFKAFKVNLSPLVNKTKRDGKEYWVMPASMIAEAVLNGSFYPKDTLLRSIESWNGRQVVDYHPQDSEGNYVLVGNSPVVYDNHYIGQLFNVHWDSELNKMQAEVHIDMEKADALDPDIRTMLEAEEIIEVSTGMMVESLESEGVFNDKPFNEIITNIYPDHLAILPTQIGAFSVADGGGLARINVQVDKLSDREKRDELYKAIREKYTVDAIYIVDVYEDNVVYEYYNYTDDSIKLFRTPYTMNDEVIELGETEEVKQKVTYETVNKINKTIYNLFTTNMLKYFNIYTVTDNYVEYGSDNVTVRRNFKYDNETLEFENTLEVIYNSETESKENEMIDSLIKSGKFNESDRPWLKELDEDKLKTIANAMTVEEKVVEKTVEVNKLTDEQLADIEYARTLKANKKAELISSIKTNSKEEIYSDEDLNDMSLRDLEKLNKLCEGLKVNYSAQAGNKPQEKTEEVPSWIEKACK